MNTSQRIAQAAEKEAYHQGFDCGQHGPNLTNCHFSFFARGEWTKAWERGKADGEKAKQRPMRTRR